MKCSSSESRGALAQMITKLFSLWSLSTKDQLELLGMNAKNRVILSKYRNGEPLSESRDTIDRVGWLLAIHKALGLLYPYSEEIRYSWVNRRNEAFNNLTPLEVMKEQGILGIVRVSRFLELNCE